MKIQDYTKLVQLIEKVETKNETFETAKNTLDAIDAMANPIEWLDAYDAIKKARRSYKKALKEYRNHIVTNDEISHIASNSWGYREDEDFYQLTRWYALEEFRHVRFH